MMVEQVTLPLIDQLCRLLAKADIVYCHWKSNDMLERSASGDNDLDLLVCRSDAERFGAIASKLGFKLAEAPPEKGMPGVLDYYGIDLDADKFIHLHVHYQMIVGNDLTKNYRLPVEKAYLTSTTQGELFRIPSIEFEFVVFVIRMVLKHLSVEAILLNQGNLRPAEQRELAYLQSRIKQDHVYQIVQHHLPFIGVELFDECLRAIQSESLLVRRLRTGQQIHNRLKAHARRSQPHDICLKLWRRAIWGIRRRILKRPTKRRLASGGALVVVAGGDGAGKSTAIAGLQKWLSQDFDVHTVHLGKPTWSWTTALVRSILSLGRMLGLYPFISETTILYSRQSGQEKDFPGYPLLIRELCKSRDRYRLYIRAKRIAVNGGLVLCDRFPLSQINLMDGPTIERLVAPEQVNWLVNRLIELEKRYYHAIVWPELLLVLKLDPQIAVERKTDEETEYVRARSQEIWSFDWQQTPATVVDASRSQDEVLTELKSLIWSAL